ncbi:hypothetical protein [Microbispora rosea]|uniref:hypothetical protein n=1 Tax=Microbispora rosea TaxID=58117 RepID=UPI0037B7BE07
MTIDNLPAARVESSLPERQEYAKALSVSNLLPKQYRDQPGNVLYAIEFGRALGVEPIVAINQVHIIEQKPSASSALISSLVRKAGHRLRVWVERDQQGRPAKAIATIVRHDDPEFEFRAEWTMARAQAAGVTGKQVWKNYPEAMLKARAITEVAREACEEALNGIGYTAEELGADQNPDGSWVVTTAPERPNQPGQTIRDAVAQAARPAAPPTPAAPAPLVVQEKAERMITEPQQKKLAALMREAGITDRAAALAFINKVLRKEQEVTSRKDLTMDEAGRVIEALEQAPESAASPRAELEQRIVALFDGLDTALSGEDRLRDLSKLLGRTVMSPADITDTELGDLVALLEDCGGKTSAWDAAVDAAETQRAGDEVPF